MPSRSSSPLPSSQPVAGATPMPTTMTSAGTTDAVAQRDAVVGRGRSPCTSQRMSMPAASCAAVARRPISAPRPAHERRRQAFEHRHRAALGPGRGGDLEADEPGADDDDAGRAVGDPRAQRQRVVERAQLVDDRHVLLAGQPPRRRAGGDDQPVVRRRVVPSASSTAAASTSRAVAGDAEAQRRGRARRSPPAGAGRCDRAPTPRPAASSTAAGGRRAGAARRRSA